MNRRSFISAAIAVAAVAPIVGDHIHTPHDGRGLRNVFVNGKAVSKAFYADARRGVVRAYVEPLRYDPATDAAASYELSGDVRVEFI